MFLERDQVNRVDDARDNILNGGDLPCFSADYINSNYTVWPLTVIIN